MNKLTSILLAVVIAVVASYATVKFVGGASSATQATIKESAYERIKRTGVIRCGYAAAQPFLVKDPNTGKPSGIAYEIMEELGKALSLKIDWAEEVGWSSFPSSLISGRIDAFCVGAWPSAARAREVDVTMPFSFRPYYAYARMDDSRFDNNVAAINDPSVTVSVMDGDTSDIVARNDFPAAKILALPELSNSAEMFENVMAKKADVTLIGPAGFAAFDAANPNKIKRIPLAVPLRVFGNVFFIARGQDELRQMLNIALGELISSGRVEKIIARHEKVPGTILRTAKPYLEQ